MRSAAVDHPILSRDAVTGRSPYLLRYADGGCQVWSQTPEGTAGLPIVIGLWPVEAAQWIRDHTAADR